TMGSIYAKISGEMDPIPQIIGDYIYPRTLEDSIPKHPLSLVLSVADRVDSLVGYFALDLFPSGSEDPIGLRRITGGLLKILIEGGLRLNVREVLEYAWKNYNFDEEKLKDQLEKGISFIVQRLRNMLLDKYPLDVVEAVINVGYEELWKLGKRLDFLMAFKDSKYYEKVVKALNRLYRILPQNFVPIVVKPELQISSYERRLYDDFIKIRDEIGKEIMGANYNVLINYEFLGNFSEDIEAFFDNVLVMSPNEEERVNRLSLLWEIKTLLWEICDWSKLS
ncbi:MAG: glycine--tRNA ligase subunit beta, partial [Dictyoglomus sp.]